MSSTLELIFSAAPEAPEPFPATLQVRVDGRVAGKRRPITALDWTQIEDLSARAWTQSKGLRWLVLRAKTPQDEALLALDWEGLQLPGGRSVRAAGVRVLRRPAGPALTVPTPYRRLRALILAPPDPLEPDPRRVEPLLEALEGRPEVKLSWARPPSGEAVAPHLSQGLELLHVDQVAQGAGWPSLPLVALSGRPPRILVGVEALPDPGALLRLGVLAAVQLPRAGRGDFYSALEEGAGLHTAANLAGGQIWSGADRDFPLLRPAPRKTPSVSARTRPFHGRGQEMAELEAAVEADAWPIDIVGLPGVGKTSLAREARRWWDRTRRFPAGSCMVHVARAEDEEDLRRMVEERLRASLAPGQLVVLDGTDEVRPGGLDVAGVASRWSALGVRVLLTGRAEHPEAAFVLHLSGLDEDSARLLVPALTQEEATQLTRISEGNPVLIQVSGRAMGGPVSSLLGALWGPLHASIFRPVAGHHEAAEWTGVRMQLEARGKLNQGYVRAETRAPRPLTPDERASLASYLAWARVQLSSSSPSLTSERIVGSRVALRGWVESLGAEGGELGAVLARALLIHGHAEEAEELVSGQGSQLLAQLQEDLEGLRSRGQTEALIIQARFLIEMSARLGARSIEDRARELLGEAHLACDEVQAAIDANERRLERAQLLGDRLSESLSLASLARIECHEGALEAGAARYREALEVAETLDLPKLRAQLSDQLATVLERIGRGAEALALREAAVLLSAGSPDFEAWALEGLARARQQHGDLGAAADCLARARGLLRAPEARERAALLALREGRLRRELGELVEAEVLHAFSRDEADEAPLERIACYEHGLDLVALGRLDEARAAFERHLALSGPPRARPLLALGDGLAKAGDLGLAAEYLQSALREAERSGEPQTQVAALGLLGAVAEAAHQAKEAKRRFRESAKGARAIEANALADALEARAEALTEETLEDEDGPIPLAEVAALFDDAERGQLPDPPALEQLRVDSPEVVEHLQALVNGARQPAVSLPPAYSELIDEAWRRRTPAPWEDDRWQRALDQLKRFLRFSALSEERFALAFVRIEDEASGRRFFEDLRRSSGRELGFVDVPHGADPVELVLQGPLEHPIVVALGHAFAEYVDAGPEQRPVITRQLNLGRDRLRDLAPPIICLLPDHAKATLKRLAPDFWTYESADLDPLPALEPTPVGPHDLLEPTDPVDEGADTLAAGLWGRVVSADARRMDPNRDALKPIIAVLREGIGGLEGAQRGFALHALGRVLLEQPGEPAQDLREAIHLFEAALPDRAGLDWAATQHALGMAWLLQPLGEPRVNAARARDAFARALEVYVPERYPSANEQVRQHLYEARRRTG